MGLLLEIQNAAADGSVSLATLLRKCRLLASRLDSVELEEWVRLELDGYPAEAEVPSYRRIPLHFKGSFSGPLGAQINNAPLPPYIVEKVSEVPGISTFECRQSIATLEARSDTSGISSINMDNMILVLRDAFYQGYSLVSFSAQFPNSALSGIENAVRNNILEFSLKLWKDHPMAGEVSLGGSSNTIPPSQLTQIFNTTVSGASNVVGTANHSNLSAFSAAGDLEELKRRLLSEGLDGPTVDELGAAIEADRPIPVSEAKFGPAVTGWIAKALGKAASGGWAIGIGAAAKVTEEGLLRYYGLK